MKAKTVLSLICTLIFISCLIEDDDDRPFDGIGIDITNITNEEYSGTKLLIGGIKNGDFISTESFDLPTIIIRPRRSVGQVVVLDGSRWKPNLRLIAKISDRAYFAFQFENNKRVLLYDSFDSSKLISFLIPNAGITNALIIKSPYGGVLTITIDENQTARATFHEN